MGQACERCQRVCPDHFRFCGYCGHRLETAAERRLLTVMFCDLVDSTRLSGQLDPEELRGLVLHYQKLCVTAIEERGGYVSQYLGDGILAYFGYPTAHELSVANAVAAALELQYGVLLHNKSAARPIEVRVGLHTGWTVVGEVGSGDHREQLALGETPNVAARIQGLAPPGGVAVSADTHRLVESLFDWKTLGVHQLKGVEREIEVFQPLVLAPKKRVQKGLLWGREPQLARLRQKWREGGGSLLLRADPGLGKSKLVASFLETLGEDVRRSEFRCSPFFRNRPLAPVTEQVDEGSLAPEARDELFSRLALPLTGVVVFEDLHWADASTLAFVAYLVERRPDGMMLLLTGRPEFKPIFPVQALDLLPLDVYFLQRVIRGAAGDHDISDELMSELVRRSDGNPLYAEELTKAALEGGLPHVPDTLASSLAARLDRLGPAREVAQVAALLGREFPAELIEALSPVRADVLKTSLEKLVEAEILKPIQDGYAFKHALLAEAAYESMLLAARRELHERTALILQERSFQPELIAHHYWRAEKFWDAARQYREAGRRAALQSAEVEAVEHFRQALRCLQMLGASDERDHEELLTRAALGPALRVVAGNADPEVRENFERASELWKKSSRDAALGMSLLYGHFVSSYVSGRLEEAGGISETMLETATTDHDRIQVHTSRAEWFWIMGRFADGMKSIERACVLYRPELSQELIRHYGQDLGCHSFVDRAILLCFLGKPTRALRSAELALELAKQSRHRFTLTYVLLSVGRLHLDRREPDQALKHLSEAAQLAGSTPFPVITAMLGIVRKDPEMARLGIEERRRKGARNMQCMLLGWLAELLMTLERKEEAQSVLREACRESEPFYLPELRRLSGEPREAFKMAEKIGSPMLQLRAALDLADPALLEKACAGFERGEDCPELQIARSYVSR